MQQKGKIMAKNIRLKAENLNTLRTVNPIPIASPIQAHAHKPATVVKPLT